MNLIDKDKLLEGLKAIKENLSASPIVVLKDVESLVESIEVKEVDLEKELDSQIRLVYGVKTLEDSKGFWGVHYDELVRFSKHFFELGLKAQKGE